jgi:glycyl-tRNA synthetase beta chain
MEHADLLIEIFCEELPAKGLQALAGLLRDGVLEQLKRLGLNADWADAEALYTPRRLSVLLPGLAFKQPDQEVERRGPALSAAFQPDGSPSRALTGFLASVDASFEQLTKTETDKGTWLSFKTKVPGRATKALLPDVLSAAVANLPIPKPMRWGDGGAAFLRPVHGLIVMHGGEVVPCSLFGVASDRLTEGHRFLKQRQLSITHFDTYAEQLRQAKVLVDPEARRRLIVEQSEAKAMRAGGRVLMREALLEEVVSLTEWPHALLCQIPKEYMRLPAAVITNTIETHQKFFPIVDAEGNLLPAFIGVANIESKDPQQVIEGYQRVVRPRLSDAAFFYDADLKKPLAGYQEELKRVTYQNRLGSLWEKTERVRALALALAKHFEVDTTAAQQAAELSRADLLSNIVGEFPELQGQMGRRYLEAQGGDPKVAVALDEFYSPRAAGMPIAASALGQLLAVAERLDTLCGIFAIGQKPSGNKDPFSLRRAALGLARTLIESAQRVDLKHALALAAEPCVARANATRAGKDAEVPAASALAEELYRFILDRLRAYSTEQGISAQVFEAVAAVAPTDLFDFDRRLKACQAFLKLPAWQSLAAANKRISNILKKVEPGQIDERSDKLVLEAEQQLSLALAQVEAQAQPLLANEHYLEAFEALASLQAPVDHFFDKVMVMAEDLSLRAQRLGLLKRLKASLSAIADVGQLAA